MPELPEVETMVRGIAPHLMGRVIDSVEVLITNYRPLTIKPSTAELIAKSRAVTIAGVRRAGKRVVLDYSSGHVVVIEPRMTGLMLLSDPPDCEHLRIRWRFSDSRPYNDLWFWDRRGLGVVTCESGEQFQQRLAQGQLGIDALEMTAENWQALCQATPREIKVLLLDQKRVAGIGNLYASEILHQASIHPQRSADTLKKREVQQLTRSAQQVLQLAIEYEGSTLGDGTYRNALNQNGRYQNEHKVYMKTGATCPHCHKGRIERIVQAQRSTFFCPNCQK